MAMKPQLPSRAATGNPQSETDSHSVSSMNGDLTPEDPLDSPDYHPTAHINALFPTIASFASYSLIKSKIEAHQAQVRKDLEELDEELSINDGLQRIQKIRSDVIALYQQVESTKSRARQLEAHLTDLTREIRRIDTAKRNLTTTMNMAKRLQMLTNAFEQVSQLSTTKQYREIASLLSAVLQLMAHFKQYRSIPQVAQLSQDISDLQRTLLEQVSAELEAALRAGPGNLTSQSKTQLSAACELVDVLGEPARERVLTAYINNQLREYRNVFRGNEEAASLDNISRRYAWLKRVYRAYEEEFSSIFPKRWEVFEMLVETSCDSTREDLTIVLSRQKPTIALLLDALEETSEFEKYLVERLTMVQNIVTSDSPRPPRASIDSMASMRSVLPSELITVDPSEREQSRAARINITKVFEPYLGVFVEQQETALKLRLESYRTAPWPGMDEQVLPSSADLFYFYLTTLTSCTKLSNGQPLLDLARLFSKFLLIYANSILVAKLTSAVVSVEEIIMVLKTADYCSTTIQQLEEKMRSSIVPFLLDKITFEHENEQFVAIAARGLGMLVKHLENLIGLGAREMTKRNWNDLTEVGDQSTYVAILVADILREGKRVLLNLERERFVRSFCDRLVEGFVATYINTIAQCRPINEIGAEQMLLDIYAIKAALLNLPGAQITQTYTKQVHKQFLRIETLLKCLLSTASPPEGLVQNYLFLIGDRSTTNFTKVLEIKGIPKSSQTGILNLFIASVQTHTSGNLVDKSPWMTALNMDFRIDAVTQSISGLAGTAVSGAAGSFFGGASGVHGLSRQNTGGLGMGSIGGIAQDRFGSKFGQFFGKRTTSGADSPR